MNIDISRRDLLKGAGGGLLATALGAFGFGEAEAA
jgi:formate dehydrogenase major subunit